MKKLIRNFSIFLSVAIIFGVLQSCDDNDNNTFQQPEVADAQYIKNFLEGIAGDEAFSGEYTECYIAADNRDDAKELLTMMILQDFPGDDYTYQLPAGEGSVTISLNPAPGYYYTAIVILQHTPQLAVNLCDEEVLSDDNWLPTTSGKPWECTNIYCPKCQTYQYVQRRTGHSFTVKCPKCGTVLGHSNDFDWRIVGLL